MIDLKLLEIIQKIEKAKKDLYLQERELEIYFKEKYIIGEKAEENENEDKENTSKRPENISKNSTDNTCY